MYRWSSDDLGSRGGVGSRVLSNNEVLRYKRLVTNMLARGSECKSSEVTEEIIFKFLVVYSTSAKDFSVATSSAGLRPLQVSVSNPCRETSILWPADKKRTGDGIFFKGGLQSDP